jgi:hypothetical protein
MRSSRVCDSLTKSLKKSRVDLMALMQSVAEVNSSAEQCSEGDSLVDSRLLTFQDLAASQRRDSGPVARRDMGLSRMLFGSEIHAASGLNDSGW